MSAASRVIRLHVDAIAFLILLSLGAVCVRADWTVHTELAVLVLLKKEAANLLPDLREPKDKVEFAICTTTIVDTGIAVRQ